MKFLSVSNISIASRIASASDNPVPSTASAPRKTATSVGDASIDKIDTGEINGAGKKVQGYQQDGNNMSNNRESENPNKKQPKYNKYEAVDSDQPPPPDTPDGIATTPAPKTKSYNESLMDQQMAKQMNQPKREGNADQNLEYNSPDPNKNVQPSPRDQKAQDRGPDRSYDSSKVKVNDPAPFPRSSYDQPTGAPTYMAPEKRMGPDYSPQSTPKYPDIVPPPVVSPPVESPGTTAPELKLGTPKFGTPKFSTPKFR